MARLEIQQLRKEFNDLTALKGIDLDVASGEFVSLLGPSGCGKTTALRIVAGFEQPTSGRVLIDGKDVVGTPPNKRDMGMVFQAYSLFPNMTAQDNVSFGLRVRGVSKDERTKKAVELLKLVGLGSHTQHFPHQLSGGQQQRVAIGRALAIEPKVLLLDEPLSALDAKVRVQLREEIRRIQSELKITALYVTHDQEEALSISDRVVVLSQGQIEQVGPPAEIYDTPSTLFVAEFIGTMNRVHGSVASDRAGIVAHDGIRLPVAAARDLAPGQRVVVLIRPESIELERILSEAPPNGKLPARITAHTFLGSVTRLSLASMVGDLTVDIPSVRALSLAVGTPVGLHWDAEAPRVLIVSDEQIQGAHAAPAEKVPTA